MYPRLIRRNATCQQATIFSQIKSAKFITVYESHCKHGIPGFYGAEIDKEVVKDLSSLAALYANDNTIRLFQDSESEFRLVGIDVQGQPSKWYTFSTKKTEAIAPSTTEEVTQVTQKIEKAIAPSPVSYPELITRGETAQQTAIFSQVKSAKLVLTLSYSYDQKTREQEVEIEDLSELPKFYARDCQAMLLKFSETEYQIVVNSGKRYVLSTKEKEIAPVIPTPAEKPTQPEINQEPATIKGLEVELCFAELELKNCKDEINDTESLMTMLKNSEGKNDDTERKMPQLQIRLRHLQSEVETLDKKATKIRRKIAAMQPTLKVDIVSIELTRVEDCDDGQPNHMATSVWPEANKMLQQWAKTAPKTGYQQCMAKLVFSDGNSITTPIKLNRWSFDVIKSITNELDPQNEISWYEMTHNEFVACLASHKLNTKNLALA